MILINTRQTFNQVKLILPINYHQSDSSDVFIIIAKLIKTYAESLN